MSFAPICQPGAPMRRTAAGPRQRRAPRLPATLAAWLFALAAGATGPAQARADAPDQSTPAAPVEAAASAAPAAAPTSAAPVGAAPSAAPAPPSWFSVSGFGTVGAAHNNNGDADYVPSVLKANGAGFTRRTSLALDSRLGVQLGVHVDSWSGVLQFVSEQKIDGSYRPTVEWGNVQWQATPDLALRAGRIALPIFLAADYRKVGYAYPWVRPPVEVYSAVPISNSDGIDATWRWNIGEVKHSTQLFFGHNNQNIGPGSYLEARRLAGVSDTVSVGALTARLSLLTTNLTVDLVRSEFDVYRQFGPAGVAMAERWDVDHKHSDAVSVGLAYDPGTWFAQGEFGRANTRSYLGDRSAWYVSAGLRRGDLTPYATLASVRPNNPTSVAGLPLQGLPPQAIPVAVMLNEGLNQILRYVAAEDTVSAGLRWEAGASVALKVQLDHVMPRGDTFGTFIYLQPGYTGRAVNVLTVSADFVF